MASNHDAAAYEIMPPAVSLDLPVHEPMGGHQVSNQQTRHQGFSQQHSQRTTNGGQQTSKHPQPFNGLAFHNPFDMNSYPITNPPIYDSTMLFPTTSESGITLRRRISISNGQIGQIVNHEALFLDEDSFDDMSPYSGQGPPLRPPHSETDNLLRPQISQIPPSAGFPDEGVAQYAQGAVIPLPQNAQQSHPEAVAGIAQPLPADLNLNGQLRVPPLAPISHSNVNPNVKQQPREEYSGVPPPNHLLIYNNEVIYNPNNGPMPGTAAWKRERLLERNRVAASKCRQRKKHAHQQLQDNMSKFENEISSQNVKIQKLEKLVSIYELALQGVISGDAQLPVNELRKYLGKNIDEIEIS